MQDFMRDVRGDLATMTATVEELRTQLVPILENANRISVNIRSITTSLDTQMLRVEETVTDVLDVVRGTIDDLERVKDDLVGTLEAPIAMVRDTTSGAISLIGKIVGGLSAFLGRDRPIRNASRRRPMWDDADDEVA